MYEKWGNKRRSKSGASASSMSLLSPLRPPAGEVQSPPKIARQKHFLAVTPSPPDSSGNSVGLPHLEKPSALLTSPWAIWLAEGWGCGDGVFSSL